MAAIVFPPNPAGQTPVNTFSTTSTPLANTSNTFTYTWNGAAWTSAPAGGAGGGTVTTVSGTLPIVVASGTTTPVISINAATAAAAGSIEIATLVEAAAGTDATRALTPETGVPKDAAGMAGAALLPGSAAVYGGTPATGMIRYNNATPPASIEYYNGSAWITLGAGATAASLAEAAAGTINTKYLSPETGVPKDAAGMTGAAILPSGTDAQRAAIATPVVGMQRFNTTTGDEEVYTGATPGWRKLAYVSSYDPVPTDLVISANTTLEGSILCKNLTINSGVTVTVANYGVVIYCTETATINGSINADFVGAPGVTAETPSYGAGSGIVRLDPISSGWNGPGVAGSPYAPDFYLGGSSAPNSAATVNATTTGGGYVRVAGGNGGGSIAIVANGAITVAATSTLSAKGQLGSGYSSAFGDVTLVGNCGGSGGTVILQSEKSVSMAGTINVSGGAGNGAGCSGGGCPFGIGGGNGGGGGTVVLQSPLTSNTGTVTLTGGAGGPGINGGGVGLQGGAVRGPGSGGAGGILGTGGGSVNGSAGSNGVIVFSGSPF